MRVLAAISFVSGISGLVYEVVWTRMLSDVVGSTVVSMAVVFSVFLVGLAGGALLFGRSRRTGAEALRTYAGLEAGIATAALATTSVVALGGPALAAALPRPDSLAGTVALTSAVAAALMGVPTLLMGGTLPILLGAAAPRVDPSRAVPLLYGWNTIGAALGALATGFVLIWLLGLPGAVLLAATGNVGVALVAFGLAAGERGHAPDRGELDATTAPEAEAGAGAPPRVRPFPDTDDPLIEGAVLWLTAFASGALVLGHEILWGRIARFLLGDRTMAIALLLFLFIAALGLASLLVDRWSRGRQVPGRRTVLLGCGAALLMGAAAHAGLVPLAARTVTGGGLAGFGTAVPEAVRRALLMAVFTGPPMLALGLVFPVLARGARTRRARPGQTVGRLYFVNTIGAVTGSTGALFVLARGPGTMAGFDVLGTIAAITGGCLLAAGLARTRDRLGALGATAATIAMTLAADGSLTIVRADERLVVVHEDEYGVQVMTRTSAGTYRVRNNRLSLVFDLGNPQTTHAQQMPAHIAMLLASRVDDVLNIGTGYGITAGAFALYPQPRTITTVELLPFLVDEQARFTPHNLGVLEDPRVRRLQDDGRQSIARGADTWDVISVNVLDPYLPGSSGLYTVDFWETARDRLRPGGVFTQLFWGEDLPMLVRGIEAVFPSVLYFPAYGGSSWTVVAFRDAPGTGDIALERLGEPARRELATLVGTPVDERLEALIETARAGRPEPIRRAAALRGTYHTDLRPILEYRWAHGVGGVSNLDSPLVEN